MPPVDLPVKSIAESAAKIAKHSKVFVRFLFSLFIHYYREFSLTQAMSDKRALLKEEAIPELREQIRALSRQRVDHEAETKCIGLPEPNRRKWHIEVFNDVAMNENDNASRFLSLIPNRDVGHACDDGEGKHHGQ